MSTDLMERAKGGCAESQLDLGIYFADKDLEKTLFWFGKAADGGSAWGMWNTLVALRGFDRDGSRADLFADMLKRLVGMELGNPEADSELGLIYCDDQDPQIVRYAGFVPSMINMGEGLRKFKKVAEIFKNTGESPLSLGTVERVEKVVGDRAVQLRDRGDSRREYLDWAEVHVSYAEMLYDGMRNYPGIPPEMVYVYKQNAELAKSVLETKRREYGA
ncbi:MAG: hypothetical protein LBE35_11275 [Clostridiales bacterium]|jgi:TPR repeat protein|nr:hypothetical protein [Clostridiales bacterium]